MNVFAARSAAASRVGWTSLACIEPEWSVTSITDASCTGTRTVVCGLASATIRAVAAARASTAGMWRRRSGIAAAARLSVETAVYRTA